MTAVAPDTTETRNGDRSSSTTLFTINTAAVLPSDHPDRLCQQPHGGDPKTSNAAQPRAVPPSHCSSTQASSASSSSCSHESLASSSSFASRLAREASTKLVDEFTPAFFIPVMGTGICSNILYRFPYPGHWLRVCGWILFVIAFFIWVLTSALFVVQVRRHPGKLARYHTDPAVAPFMGCWPMAMTTIINFLGSILRDNHAGIVAVYVLFWIMVAASVYCVCVIWFYTFLAKPVGGGAVPEPTGRFGELHATLLLPVVTLTVAASSGGLLVPAIPANLQVPTMVACFILWANAIVLSFIVTTIYFWKLVLYKIPSTHLVFTSFLPVGFLGQGAYGILLFGANVHELVAKAAPSSHYFQFVDWASTDPDTFKTAVGSATVMACGLVSLLLTSFGYFMTFVAVVSCMSKCRPFARNPNPELTHPTLGYIKFTKAFWAMTFPLGTMSLSNTEVFRVFGDGYVFFRVMGTIYGVALTAIVLGCLVGVVYGIYAAFRRAIKVPSVDDKV